MKKFIIFIALIFFVSCNENERLLYDLNSHDIYFRDIDKKKDSLIVSLFSKEEVSTSKFQLKILGSTLETPQKFKVEVIKDRTTAVEGVHYKKLPDFYEFPTKVIEFGMPIEFIRGADDIKVSPVILTISIAETEGMSFAFEDRRVVRIKITDYLIEPRGSDMADFKTLFGDYSRTKHAMIIELAGHDFWDGEYGAYGGAYGLSYEMVYYTPIARKLYKMITTGEYYDENGNLMGGWNVA